MNYKKLLMLTLLSTAVLILTGLIEYGIGMFMDIPVLIIGGIGIPLVSGFIIALLMMYVFRKQVRENM